MNADGSDQRRVLAAAAPDGSATWFDGQPVWSPDGNWIAYSSGGGESQGADLFIVHPDGSDRINLTPGTAAQHVFPDWQARCHTQGAISSEPTASA
jgi:Tol biopolymer transport system component